MGLLAGMFGCQSSIASSGIDQIAEKCTRAVPLQMPSNRIRTLAIVPVAMSPASKQ
jgi:hypothetical protein